MVWFLMYGINRDPSVRVRTVNRSVSYTIGIDTYQIHRELSRNYTSSVCLLLFLSTVGHRTVLWLV
jgi:hypothetical protein